jgi:predicted Zn-dependent peptidase
MNRFGMIVMFLLASLCNAQEIKFEKYTLPNGMNVILHEDHNLPVASINIWYGVGSQDEPPGRSGFAHLFEHLMFMGTERVPDNQFDVLMETGGGANNANTDLHRTNYFSWGPSELLPTLLWLDADRLEDFGRMMNQDKLDKQRDVVRNELRQSVENAPYGKADEAIFRLLFPADHPYVTGVIGTHEDLEAATVMNVKDFFANFYVPRNASLVVAGDFDSAKIKPLVESLFGTIPSGAPVSRKYDTPREDIPIKSAGVKRMTVIDKVELPRLQYTFGGPVWYGAGDAELKLAADILASGPSSRLYKRLIMDESLAADVNASFMGYPLAGIFQLNVLAKPDANLDRIESIVAEEIEKMRSAGPTTDEISRCAIAYEREILKVMQSIEAKAASMNEYEAAWGTPDGFARDITRFRDADVASVKAWCEKALTLDAVVITRVLPESPERSPGGRDAAPEALGIGVFNPPIPQSVSLSNGLQVLIFPRAELPLVSMMLMSKPEGGTDPASQPGLTALAMEMLSQGAGERDANAFADELQRLGADFSAQADEESFSLSMSVLKRNFAAASALFADALLRPRMTDSDFERTRSLKIDELAMAMAQPAYVAAITGASELFAADNPYASPMGGTEQSLAAMTVADVKRLHTAYLDPSHSVVVIAGDVSVADVRGVLEPLIGGFTRSADATSINTNPGGLRFVQRDQMKVVVVDRPGATQTVIHFAMPSVTLADPKRVSLEMLNIILGGSFTSRLNQNLRERNGYTYGARSNFALYPSTGCMTASARVATDVTGAALREFFNEFTRIAAGDISEDELSKARKTFRNETAQSFASLDSMIATTAVRLNAGLPAEMIKKDLTLADRVKVSDLNELAKSMIVPLRGVLILVGDAAAISPQIAEIVSNPEVRSADKSGVE